MFKSLLVAGALATLVTACGSSSDGTGENAPPRTTQESDGNTFALESGSYGIDKFFDLSDGCGSNPLAPEDPITAATYTLTNAGAGRISLDSCSYGGTSTIGDILSNKGVLHVAHSDRQDNVGSGLPGIYDQDCRIDIAVTGNNTFTATFTERQSGRNAAMKEATNVNADSCTTSYKYTMSKRS